MMRSSIPDGSSLFVLREPQPTAAPAGDYILQATGASSRFAEPSRNFLEFGVVPHRRSGHPLAIAVERALASEQSTFFEEVDGLASLISHVLPVLLPTRRYAQTLRLWSAGCGTGQQTYSLAIALAELCPGLATWNFDIVGSDADAWSVARARQGIYTPSEVQRGLPTEWLVRHFEQLPAGGGWRFTSRLRERMSWLRLDPSRSCAAVGEADIVVCHQKLGQSECETRPVLLARLTDQLASDGFLILPSPEATLERGAGFERLHAGGPAVYRRVKHEISLLSA
jgi:chemotaxis protein methyltransferase CheR